MQKDREHLKKIYYKEVSRAIVNQKEDDFVFLIKKGKPFLDKNSKLKVKVLAYSHEVKQLQNNAVIKDLEAQKELDDRSYAFMQKMQDEYKAYQAVLAKAEALKLRQLLSVKEKGWGDCVCY